MDEKIPETGTLDDTVSVICNVLTENIQYQNKWRRRMSYFHTLTTVGSIICSTGATISGASGYSLAASVMAAFATVFIGVEKTMMLSEKWGHHLSTETRLRNIQLQFETGQIGQEDCVREIIKAMESYATQLPIENQEAMDEIRELLLEMNKARTDKLDLESEPVE